jgi:glycosyltransferase involved in cell wall biosynthesis
VNPTPISVAAFTGGSTVPSARFRVRQYITPLAAAGISLHEYAARFGRYPPESKVKRPLWGIATLASRIPDLLASHRYDVTLLQRELVSTLATLERLSARPRVLDVDDAIWQRRGGSAARTLAQWSDLVICGNTYLANWFGKVNPRIQVIPTAVDTERFSPGHRMEVDPNGTLVAAASNGLEPPPFLVWSGLHSGFRELAAITEPIAAALAARPRARFRVISDRRPNISGLQSERIDFVRWSPQTETVGLHGAAAGIMPLDDTEWNRGKCSYKMLLYMASGVPVIASPVGMNAEVFAKGDIGLPASDSRQWTDALVALLDDASGRFDRGERARQAVETYYSLHALGPQLANALRSVVQ